MAKKFALCGAVMAACLTVAAMAGAPGGAPAGGPGGPGGPGGMAGRGGRGGGAGGAPANISGAMRDMSTQLRAIKVEGDADTITASLKALASFERDVAIAKMNVPPKVEAMTGEEKTKALENYRAELTVLQHTLLDLEDAIVAKKTDEANKLVAKLGDIQKKGHADFR